MFLPSLSFFLVAAARWHVVSVVDRSGPWLRFLRSCAVAKQHLTGTGALDIWYSSTSATSTPRSLFPLASNYKCSPSFDSNPKGGTPGLKKRERGKSKTSTDKHTNHPGGGGVIAGGKKWTLFAFRWSTSSSARTSGKLMFTAAA